MKERNVRIAIVTSVFALVILGCFLILSLFSREPIPALPNSLIEAKNSAPTIVTNTPREKTQAPISHASTEDSKSLIKKIAATKASLIQNEKNTSKVIFSKEGDNFSNVAIFIEKPDKKIRQEVTGLIQQYQREFELSSPPPNEAEQISKELKLLSDFIHWKKNPDTGLEYDIRVVSWLIYSGQGVEREDVLVDEAETYSVVGEGDDAKIQYHGNSSSRKMTPKSGSDRYGHLFKITKD